MIGWGVVGCGSIASKVIPAIIEAENSRLIAVMSRSMDKARRFAEKYGASRYYDDLSLLLRDGDVDAVYISTPTFLHASQTIMAAEAGKHVLCEKPMAMNLDECLRMVDACRRNGVKLMIGHHMRFKPDNRMIREIIEHGRIGRVTHIRAQHSTWYKPEPTAWRMIPKLGGGGSLMDLGVHCIDLLRFLLGSEVREVAAFTYSSAFNYPVEDTAVVMMKFESGACGIVNSCFNAKYSEKILEVYGTEGTILSRGTIGPRTGVVSVYIDGREEIYEFGEFNPYVAEIEHFADCIMRDEEPIISGEKCLGTMKAVFSAYESSRTGRFIRI